MWSNGDTTSSISNLSAGTYSLVVMDDNGCLSDTFDVTINEPDSLAISVDNVTDVSCNGGSDGKVSVSVSGGTTPYDYNWSTGDSTATPSSLGAGSYTLVVTDANNCSSDTTGVTIDQPDSLDVQAIDVINVTCAGGADGSIDVAVSGGTSPYSYNWNTGDTTQDLSGISAGTYGLVVTDSLGCTSDSLPVTITEPDSIAISVDQATDVSCAGASDGSVDVSVSGGTAPYSYNWSNNDTTQDLSNLDGGTYTLVVTDTLGCESDTLSIAIDEPDTLSASLNSVTDVNCAGNATGSIDVSVTGGTTPYSYNWSNGDSSQDLTNVDAGTYSVVVTDDNGCTADTLSATIDEPDTLQLDTAIVTDVSCFDQEDGSIDISVSGGTPPYSYNWSNNDSTQDIVGLDAGQYQVVISDANGCNTDLMTFTITEPNLINAGGSVTNVTCRGDATGSIDVTVSGGSGNYSYNWSNAATSQDLQNVEAGSYTVTVTDSSDCSVEETFDIKAEDSIQVSLVDSTHATCDTSSDGSIEVQASQGQGSYVYVWSNNQSGASIDSLAAGSYTVTATDQNGCSASLTVDLGVKFDTCKSPEPPVANDDSASTVEGDPVTINVLVNDYDPDSEDLTVSIYTNPDNGSVTLGPDSTVDYEPDDGFTGTDTFQYIICDPTGLCDTATVTIEVDELPDIFIPDGFSPNGDGKNDKFEVENLELYKNEIVIFNRWGNEVYRTDDYQNDWEGTYNGEPLPDGTYYYILKVWEDDDKTTFTGFIQIHRAKGNE